MTGCEGRYNLQRPQHEQSVVHELRAQSQQLEQHSDRSGSIHRTAHLRRHRTISIRLRPHRTRVRRRRTARTRRVRARSRARRETRREAAIAQRLILQEARVLDVRRALRAVEPRRVLVVGVAVDGADGGDVGVEL